MRTATTRDQMEVLVTDRMRVVRAATAGRGLRHPDDEQLLRLAQDRVASVERVRTAPVGVRDRRLAS
jgi:hypothetical protein